MIYPNWLGVPVTDSSIISYLTGNDLLLPLAVLLKTRDTPVSHYKSNLRDIEFNPV